MDITIGNTPLIWRISTTMLAFYCLTVIPIGYIFYTHGRRGLSAWLLLTLYILLQLAGHGIIAGAGEGGAPTYIAYVLTSVGLAPLMMGTAAILHEWFLTTRIAHEGKNAETAKALLVAFHFIGIWGLAFMAGGGAIAGTQAFGQSMYQASAFFLAVLFLVLTLGSLGLWWHYSKASCRPLIWSLLLSLPFLGVRYLYQLASAFIYTTDNDVSPIYGKLVYKVCLEMLPQAIVVLVLIVGAVLGRKVNQDARYGAHDEVPLTEEEGDEDVQVAKRR